VLIEKKKYCIGIGNIFGINYTYLAFSLIAFFEYNSELEQKIKQKI